MATPRPLTLDSGAFHPPRGTIYHALRSFDLIRRRLGLRLENHVMDSIFFHPPVPATASKLAELCWDAMMKVDPEADDRLILGAMEYSGLEPSPESMRIIAQYLWKEGFSACLRAQEVGAFARVENN